MNAPASSPTSSDLNPPSDPVPALSPSPPESDRRILPAFILVLLFGVFGAHRFYTGKIGTAILELCTCGGLGIWALIDLILIVCGVFTDDQGRKITQWT